MNFKQLSHFISLIEHRNFGRAAEACNITQPAFSRSIRILESELGCQLVDRNSGRNLQPTPQGERVLRHAITLLRGMTELTSEINQTAKLDIGEVRFGSGPVPAASLVPRAIARFINLHPFMQVQLDVENWQKLHHSLQREEIDFLVAAAEPFLHDRRYDVILLRPQSLSLVCRRGHPLMEIDQLDVQKLFSYAFGIVGASRDLLMEMTQRHGIPGYRLGFECDNLHTLLTTIGHSDIVGLLHAHSFERVLKAENIVELPNILEKLYARYAIVSVRGRTLSPAAERLRQVIVETDEQLSNGMQFRNDDELSA